MKRIVYAFLVALRCTQHPVANRSFRVEAPSTGSITPVNDTCELTHPYEELSTILSYDLYVFLFTFSLFGKHRKGGKKETWELVEILQLPTLDLFIL